MPKSREEFYGKLKEIARKLPEYFIMIHQSHIVNQDYICEYAYETVKMADGTLLSISKPCRKEVRSRIKQYRKERMHGNL